jgi:ribose-phosphate pyrophosphokinase
VLAMDLHAPQIQGFFDVPVDHLYAAPVLNDYFFRMELPTEQIVIVSPDEGSIKRAMQHVENLGGTLAIVDKRRSSATDVRQANVIGGPIEGKVALIFDDMISTAGSIVGAVTMARRLGARKVYVGATHGIFCGPAVARLNEAPVDEIVVTDSLPCPVAGKINKLRRVSIAPMVGEAIRRIHRNESVSYLFGGQTRHD